MPGKHRRLILESWHAKAQNDGLTVETLKLPSQYFPLIQKAESGWCKLQKRGCCGPQITHNVLRTLNPEGTPIPQIQPITQSSSTFQPHQQKDHVTR